MIHSLYEKNIIKLRPCIIQLKRPEDWYFFSFTTTLKEKMSRRSPITVFLTFLYFCFCLMGFLYQMFQVTVSYSNYEVRTKVELMIPNKISTPSLTVCFRVGDIFDYDAYRRISQSKMSYETGRHNDYEQLMSNTSIRDLFTFTPNETRITDACSLRKGGHYFLDQWTGSDACNHIFTTTKFFTMEYMCYMFNVTDELQLWQQIEHFSYSADHPGMMMQVVLNKTSFRRAEKIRLAVHGWYLPTSTIGFSPTVERYYEPVSGKAVFDYFSMSFRRSKTKSLPAPYPTKCFDYSIVGLRGGQRSCFTACFTHETTVKFQKVMFSDVVMEPSPMGIVTRDIVQQNSTKDFFSEIGRKCAQKCSSVHCIEYFYMTDVFPGFDTGSGIVFQVNAPRHLFYQTYYSPATTFIDYFVYTSSLLGIWFGFSVWYANPIPFWKHAGRKCIRKIKTVTVRNDLIQK